MNVLKNLVIQWIAAWDRFWFTPRIPHLMGVLRILTGCMLLYSHLVLFADLDSFIGTNAWISNEVVSDLHDGTLSGPDATWSYLRSLDSPVLIGMHHFITIVITAMFAVGFLTRFTAPLAWFLQLMLIHRLTGALFGFDQIVTYAAMYVMLAPSGGIYSVDAFLRRRLADRRESNRFVAWLFPDSESTVSSNIATRLLQIHLCVIYLFGALAKARGVSWWDGTAIWYAIGNFEYQSMDMTWLADWPRVFSAMSHTTLFWELFYVVLIWPRATRPVMLGMAIALHGGIAIALGMKTFGLMMIAANFVFLPTKWFAPSDDEPAQNWSEGDAIDEREVKLQAAIEAFELRKEKLRSKEKVYLERVERLKRRESKIKDLADRAERRKKGEQFEPDDDPETEA
jgi:uncharacterized membrane protein YphA (DoxX/SURF4 family)